MSEPTKLSVHVQLSPELMADSNGMAEAVRRALFAPRLTPEQVAERRKGQEERRFKQREAAVRMPLTLDLIVERMGWSTAYAEHLVQPYCTCGPHGADGEWEVCEHAYDLGVTW